MVAKKPKLRPGKGATGNVLTRFIKPKQPVPHANHRSDVIIEDRISDDDGKKETYTFRLAGMPIIIIPTWYVFWSRYIHIGFPFFGLWYCENSW